MKGLNVLFVGGGRIVRIILGGWNQTGFKPGTIRVQEPNEATRQDLKTRFPSLSFDEDTQADQADVVIVAVHPPSVLQVLKPLSGRLRSEALVLSLAPRISITQISEALGGFARVARCIPNAPTLIGQGLNPVTFADGLAADGRGAVLALLEPLGVCPVVPEGQLEAYAVLTAMGPTYFWFQFQTLRELGQTFGLDAAATDAGLEQMIVGAARLLFSSGVEAEQVLDLVPVKPMQEEEDSIRETLRRQLTEIYGKLKG